MSFGGTARGPLLQTVISALKRSGDAFGQVTVFVGGGEFAHPPVGGICFKQPDSDMSLVLAGADAGIIAAGTMLHEACATGLPCAVVSLGPEQAAEAAALAARGAILYLGAAEDLTVDAAAASLDELGRVNVRARLSERARRTMDGHGRVRVVDGILERVANGTGAVDR